MESMKSIQFKNQQFVSTAIGAFSIDKSTNFFGVKTKNNKQKERKQLFRVKKTTNQFIIEITMKSEFSLNHTKRI